MIDLNNTVWGSYEENDTNVTRVKMKTGAGTELYLGLE